MSASAIAVLWLRRRSLLDQWLMIVALATILEMALGAIFVSGRFSLGFYAGRLFSLLTSTIVLVVLLAETTRLYATVARSQEGKIRRLVDANIIGDLHVGFRRPRFWRPTKPFSASWDTNLRISSRAAYGGRTSLLRSGANEMKPIDTRAQVDRNSSAIREGVLPERWQPCSRADRRGELRGRWRVKVSPLCST